MISTINKAKEKDDNLVLEYRIIRKDTTIRWIEDRISFERDEQEKLVSILGIAHDITKYKELEEKIRSLEAQNSKLRKTSVQKS